MPHWKVWLELSSVEKLNKAHLVLDTCAHLPSYGGLKHYIYNELFWNGVSCVGDRSGSCLCTAQLSTDQFGFAGDWRKLVTEPDYSCFKKNSAIGLQFQFYFWSLMPRQGLHIWCKISDSTCFSSLMAWICSLYVWRRGREAKVPFYTLCGSQD